MNDEHLCVCYFGTYRAEYSRNQIMIEALRRNGVEVIECHTQLWESIEDRVEIASGGWKRPRFWLRVITSYFKLIKEHFNIRDYNILVVGYPGQFDVYLARLLSWLRRKPLGWDVFMSIYLISVERQLDRRSAFTIKLLKKIEKFACRLPDLLILDTKEYAKWFEKTHGIPAERFLLVPTGADDRVFHASTNKRPEDGKVQVVYHGTFIPNHGVEYIVEAARLLSDDPTILFQLIGTGPDLVKSRELAQKYGLTNITFLGWMEKTELVEHLAQADICLGAFGTTPQSIMTVQNKIYECLAMSKPVITGDSPTVREYLEHGRLIYLVKRANPEEISRAILHLKRDVPLRNYLAENGRRDFQEHYTTRVLGSKLVEHLVEVSNTKVN